VAVPNATKTPNAPRLRNKTGKRSLVAPKMRPSISRLYLAVRRAMKIKSASRFKAEHSAITRKASSYQRFSRNKLSLGATAGMAIR